MIHLMETLANKKKPEHFKDYCGNTTGGEVSSANDG